ncbi:MAG TPA: helix-turn-helix domain-containing protein [Verrucomicrobiae bacterium]|jgi:excisionase family DNA binding protein|nr:helix-turn-helix domain-containing protein [Verrucomicrobiae bacterium]
MQGNLLTTTQVARYLRVDKFTIYRLVAQKKIPAFRVGNQWRFRKSMIDAWLMKNLNSRKNRSLGANAGEP